MKTYLSVMCSALLGGLAFTACVDELPLPPDSTDTPPAGESPTAVADKPVNMPAPPMATCATPSVNAWTGTASRTTETYPDDVEATITWQLAESAGCIDRYRPQGEAHYRFAIPGALCTQTIAPATLSVAGAHGVLTIDRTVSPATYTMSGETAWQVTWTCTFDDGTSDSMTFAAGGHWLDAAGTVDGATIDGTRVQPDGALCGRGQSGTPCTYEWSFTATP
jgi:hypothetical protein